MKYLYAIFLSLFTLLLYASPEDHGRWYAEHSSSTWGIFDILGLVFLVVVVVVWGVMKLNGGNTSNNNYAKNIGNNCSSVHDSSSVRDWGPYTTCPKCGGRGSWKGDSVAFDDNGIETCPECHGFRKQFSSQALIAYHNYLDCITRYNGDSSQCALFARVSYKRALEKELEGCSPCPCCKGNGVIRHYEIIETDTGRYKKEICNKCNGVGLLKNGKAVR